MLNVTGVIITKNEADNIVGCIKTLRWCDAVIVVDSYSTDQTLDLAQQHGARVVQHPFKDYASQKRFAVQQAQTEWVCMIDADERFTPELVEEIIVTLPRTPPDVGGFAIPMQDFMFGKKLYHGGWYRFYRISLFRKSCFAVSKNVHERITVMGRTEKMNNLLLHYSHFTIDHFLYKLNKYTTLEARAAYEQGKRTNLLKLVALPLIVFVYKYFRQQGFRDGLHGYAVAMMMSMYHFAYHIKLLMLDYQQKHPEELQQAHSLYDVHPRDLGY